MSYIVSSTEFPQTGNVRTRRRGLFYFLLVLLLINEVSLLESMEGFIGGSAVLPCSSKEPQLNLQDITVHWRHNGLSVYYIIKGKGSVDYQDPAYKNRTETFPEEYLKGNFSLKLNNLQHNDAGKYKCYITQEPVMKSVQLVLKEREKIHDTNNTNEGSNQKPEMIVMIISTLCIGIMFYFG